MRTAISTPSPGGSFLIISLPHNVTVALRPGSGPSLIDTPHDIFGLSPNLAMLSLAEPPSPAFARDLIQAAEVSLVYLDTTSGHLETVSEQDARLCGAYVCQPALGHVEYVDAATLVNLIARGLVIQILTGVAASQGAHLDEELAALIESLPDSEDDDEEA